MADNFYYTDPSTGLLLFRSVERTLGEDSVHNQVVEVNVGAATEALWDGKVSLAEISSIMGALGSIASAAGASLNDTQLRAADVKVTLDSEAVALAAGTATIGKLGANSGVDIGDVDVTSLPAPSAIPHAVDFTGSQTGETIWTPASGKRFAIVGYHLSFTAAGIITVWEGSTNDLSHRVFRHSGAIAGGAAPGFLFVSRAADNALKYTTDETAAGSLSVFGYELA